MTVEDKAYYYEQLLERMVEYPIANDDIQGVYYPGTAGRDKMEGGKPVVMMTWNTIKNKLTYTLAVIPFEYNRLQLWSSLDFIKNEETTAWVKKQNNKNIIDKGNYYQWIYETKDTTCWMYDCRLTSRYSQIPDDIMFQAAFTIKEHFANGYCSGFSGNPYFQLRDILE